MTAERDLVPCTPEDVQRSLAFALCFDGKKQYRRADDMMAQIVAQHLFEHLKRSGYVVMHAPKQMRGPGMPMT